MAGTTDQFFELVERTFNVKEITPEKIMEKFYSGTFGKIKFGKDKKGKQRLGKSQATIEGQSKFMGLAERLAEGREIYEDIDKESKKKFPDFDNLRELKNKASLLDIHSKEVVKKARDSMDDVLVRLKTKKVEELEKAKRIADLEERKESIISDLDNIDNLSDLDNAKKRLKNLKKQDVDVSDIEDRIESIRLGLQEQREAEKQERIRIQKEQQAEARVEKERQRAQGIEPEF